MSRFPMRNCAIVVQPVPDPSSWNRPLAFFADPYYLVRMTDATTHIFLATGRNARDFGPLPWISGIVGKQPPWRASQKI